MTIPASFPETQADPMLPDGQPHRLGPRVVGTVNWVGLETLYLKEVRRFVKVSVQTISAPVVTTLLYFAIFSLALGGQGRMVGDVPFLKFLGPGLIIMGMVQNAFANTSSSMMQAKIQGSVVDILMAPLSGVEIMLAYLAGGITRGLLVGIATGLAIALFQPLGFAHPFFIVYHAVAGTIMLSLLGLAGGMWAEKFDHLGAITNFVVMPLTFLSGTFYSIDRMPALWQRLAHLNPFFYMIDGFRYGFIGQSDGTLGAGLVMMAVIDVVLAFVSLRLLTTGYKLKS